MDEQITVKIQGEVETRGGVAYLVMPIDCAIEEHVSCPGWAAIRTSRDCIQNITDPDQGFPPVRIGPTTVEIEIDFQKQSKQPLSEDGK